jgi:hypothetical protein
MKSSGCTRFQILKQRFVLLFFSSESLEEENSKKITFFNILGEYFE